jgi:hypothetical protein
MKTYAVWESEYPEGGSEVFQAYSASGARRKWRKATGTIGSVSEQPELTVSEMTADDLLLRNNIVSRFRGLA